MWSLLHNSTTSPLSTLGLTRPIIHRESMGLDTLTLTALQAADAAPIFADGDQVSLLRDGVTYFTGTCTSAPVAATAGSSHAQYTISGPWSELAGRVYRQAWAIQGSDGTYRAFRKPHLMLGYAIDLTPDGNGVYTGTPQAIYATVPVIIQDILDYAIANGAAIAYDISTLPAMQIPVAEHRDGITCSQAIVQILRWVPDTVSYWDYSTTPPTLHFQRRAGLTALSLPLGEPPLAEYSLTPRYDLQVPCVQITYERTDSVNDATVAIEVVETYPPTTGHAVQQVFGAEDFYADPAGAQLGALVATCDLRGYSATVVSAQISVQDCDPSNGDWWGAHVPTRTKDKIKKILVSTWSSSESLVTCPNEITAGAWYPWMPVLGVMAIIHARAKITYETEQGQEDVRWEDLSASVLLTNAPLGTGGAAHTLTYTATQDAQSGEDIPCRIVGGNTITLSQDLYDSLSPLQWAGRILLREPECGSLMSSESLKSFLSAALNITGSNNSAWSTMAAMVCAYEEDIDTGTTTLQIGPPEHLAPQDLLALFQLTRNRWRYHNPAIQTTKGLQSSGGTDITPTGPGGNGSSSSPKGWEKFSVSTAEGSIIADTQSTGNMKLMLTPQSNTRVAAIRTADLSDSGGNAHSAQFREILYCDTNGTQRRILVLASKPYDPATGQEYDPITGA